MTRRTICSACGHPVSETIVVCPHCGDEVRVKAGDLMDLKLESSNDGYHSVYSQPTSYHMVYRCLNFNVYCQACLHQNSRLCKNGTIDIRVRRLETADSVCYQWDDGIKPYGADEAKQR